VAQQQLLLVERDAKTRRLLKVSLERAGYAVTTVRDGADALARLELSTPALVLAATNLPKLDGYALVRRMKDHTEWARIPVIFLITGESIEDKIRGLELGVEEYLQKPVFVKELLSRVQVLLARRVRLHLSESAAQTRVAGSLADLTPIDLIESLAGGEQTGVLRISGERSGEVFFEKGEITDARHLHLRVEEALFRMLGWDVGTFEVVPGEVTDERTIEEGTRAVIDAGMRHAAEYNRLVAQLPSIDTVMLVDPDELASHAAEIPEALHGFLELFDGERTVEHIIDESPFDDLSTLETIAKLDSEGMLSVVERDEEPEPAALEPAAAEPVAEEPVAEEPVAEEPVAEEPVAEEPAAAPPPIDEPAPPLAERITPEEPAAPAPPSEDDEDDVIYSQVTARPPASREALVVDADTSGSGAFEAPRPPADAPGASAEPVDTRSWSSDIEEGAEFDPGVDPSERPTVALPLEATSSPGIAGSELELTEVPSSPGGAGPRDSMDAMVESAPAPPPTDSLDELDWDDDDDLAVTRDRQPGQAPPEDVTTEPAEPEELEPEELEPEDLKSLPASDGVTPPGKSPFKKTLVGGMGAMAADEAKPEPAEDEAAKASSEPSPATPAPDTETGHRPPPTPDAEAVAKPEHGVGGDEATDGEAPPSDTDSKPELSETVRSRRGDEEEPSSKQPQTPKKKKKKKKRKKGDGPPSSKRPSSKRRSLRPPGSKRPSSRPPGSRRPLSESGISAQWYDAAPEGEEEEEPYPESVEQPEYLTEKQVTRKERGKRIVAAVVGLLLALAVWVFWSRRDTAPKETGAPTGPTAVDTGSATTPTPTAKPTLTQISPLSPVPVAAGGAGGANAAGGAKAAGGAGGAKASGGADGGEELPEVDDPLKMAGNKLNVGDYKGSIPFAKAAIKKNPGHADAYYFLALAYESIGQNDKKLDTFDACKAKATEGQYLAYCKRGARKK